MPTQAPTAGQSSSWPLELRYKAKRSTRLSVHSQEEFGTRIAENGALCQAEQLVAAYDGNVSEGPCSEIKILGTGNSQLVFYLAATARSFRISSTAAIAV